MAHTTTLPPIHNVTAFFDAPSERAIKAVA